MQRKFDRRLIEALGGVCGVHVTPFDASGAVWHDQLAKVVDDIATARAKVRSIAPFEAMRAMQGNGCNVTVVKESLRLLGIEVGDVRPPGTVALSADEVRALARILRGWDLPVKTARAA